MITFCQLFTIMIGITTATDTRSPIQPKVVPKNLIVQTGRLARFNCTAVQTDPVYWTTKPYGSTTAYDIYIGEEFLVDDYGRSRRFAVEVNSTEKRYDLVIYDTMLKDGGVYICIDGRGLGKKAYAELAVYGRAICQEDSPQKSYMGPNVFELNQDIMRFSCRMNYSGNPTPRFEWFAGGRTLEGTRGSESEMASSSLELVPRSILNNARVTWEAVLQQDSKEVGRTGIIWTSGPLHIHFAEWHNTAVNECPGVEWTLNCNPRCTYELELVNGTNCCLMNYSTGTDFYQKRSCVETTDLASEPTGSSTNFIIAIILAIIIIISLCVVILAGYLHGRKHKLFRSRCATRDKPERTDVIALKRQRKNIKNRQAKDDVTQRELQSLNQARSPSNAGVPTQGHSASEANPTLHASVVLPISANDNPASSNPTSTSHFLTTENDSNCKNQSSETNELNSATQNVEPCETVPTSEQQSAKTPI